MSINTKYSYGDSEDDADHGVYKIPHKMKTHWQNQLKISAFV